MRGSPSLDSVIFAAIGTAILALVAWTVFHRRQLGRPTALLSTIGSGLAFDNGTLAAGRLLHYGESLYALNVLRFWLHALLTPLIIVAAASIAVRSGVHIDRRARALVALTTAVSILAGCVEMLTAPPLVPRAFGDVLRYTHAATLVPLPSILTVLAVIGAGVLIWRRSRSSWLLVGGVAMLFAAGIGTPLWLGNVGELLLLGSLVLGLWAASGASGAEGTEHGRA
ncbi:hypothetical protein FK268_13645 [Tsukamurella sputi]|uniref:DUF998 domain-containing protein n=1 Tax=Tsukamurella sputi TaxID=2591848 RepID=A0A5C5RML0_9ACTN|nr:hypothetical protein [Tsukamurella sputi]TWS23335.1 hypothetical protein FK268_13645 [Tsukamurella sputi]